MHIGSGLNITQRQSRLSAYAAAGLEPPITFDFSTNYFRKNNLVVGFSDLFTHARTSIATYKDSSGVIQTASSGDPRFNNYEYVGGNWVGPYMLVEPAAATNLLLNSDTLSTQNVTVAAVANTLHFTGTGTITLTGVSTAGPLVGTGTGENNRVSLTFTPTAGTLTCTVSGTVTNAQLELGSVQSSYILTAGGTVTRNLETLVIPSANLASVVNTTAMSMSLNGLNSYADLGAAAQTVLSRWYVDANNSIIIDMDTDGGATGEINFNQNTAGTLDTVASRPTAYEAGINVAFNVASRHTSGAINGSIDGIALTENATPVALADLSSADLQLAHTGIHNIKQGSLWGVDIGYTGIQEAAEAAGVLEKALWLESYKYALLENYKRILL